MAAIDTAKVLLGITGSDKDELLQLLIAETEEYIKDYCHVKEIPQKLVSAVPFMAAELYRAKGYGAEGVPTDIKSVTEGGRSYTYEIKRPSDAFSAFRGRLNKHRKGRMPSDINGITED